MLCECAFGAMLCRSHYYTTPSDHVPRLPMQARQIQLHGCTMDVRFLLDSLAMRSCNTTSLQGDPAAPALTHLLWW